MVKIIAEGAGGKYTVKQLLSVMKALRSPGGCPWDIEQTHKSIRNDAIEEIYEVADAIDNDDKEALCEELGDVLLQVVFHSRIAEENGDFSFEDVVDGICKKLILRHPHVFADAEAETSGQVLDLWDSIKKEEKNQQTFTDTLESVPKAFPALMRASKVQKRAKKAGVDLGNTLENGMLEDKLAGLGSGEDLFTAYGDALFALTALQNSLGVNAEEALAAATDRFIADFKKCEESGEI